MAWHPTRGMVIDRVLTLDNLFIRGVTADEACKELKITYKTFMRYVLYFSLKKPLISDSIEGSGVTKRFNKYRYLTEGE